MLPADRVARVLLPSFFHSHCPTPSFPSRSPSSLCRYCSFERSTLDKTRHAKLISSAFGSRLIASPRFHSGSVSRDSSSVSRFPSPREFSVPSLKSRATRAVLERHPLPGHWRATEPSARKESAEGSRDRLAIKTQVPTVPKRFRDDRWNFTA